jgi:glycosyltransferase involved in cell wall biosynthesis
MIPAAEASIKFGVPYVVTTRGGMMRWSMQHKWLKKRLYLKLIEKHWVNRAAALHCTSFLETQEMAPLHLGPPTAIIPNGLDDTWFTSRPSRGAFREKLNIPRDALLSVFVGRLHSRKLLDLTIEAFAVVTHTLPGAHLALVGPDDGAEASLRDLVFRLGISDKVHFCGLMIRPDLDNVYADSDLLVLLAASEAFAMCVAEAMASGVPVLVSHAVGLAREVEQASAGCVVRPDLGEVAKTWLQLILDPRLSESGKRGRELARERFNHRVVATQMLDLFSRVCRSNRERPQSNDLGLH